jgi:NADH-quinone oxidoreductase subunit N
VTLLGVLLVGARKVPAAAPPALLISLSVVGLAAAYLALAFKYDEGRTVFSGMVALDGFGLFFRGLFILAGLAGVLLGGLSRELDRERLAEYLVLLLSVTLGLQLLASAQHLLMVYLALELVSLPSYVLAGFRRRSRQSSESALKYVIYGGVASGLMLYGFSLIYGLTGSLHLSEIGRALAAIEAHDTQTRLLLFFAGALSFAGFGYKIAAVPFHMWCPDVYQGAPTPFVAFLSVAPKAGGIAALIRFVVIGFGLGTTGVSVEGGGLPWALLLAIVSVATMTLGNLVAIPQSNLKRLLAYSSIAHAGYMLMAVALASDQAIRSVMFYIAVYLAMNFGAFFVVMVVRDATGDESIDGCRGLGSRSPVLAISMAVFLFSLTGLPPLAGFVGKFYLFAALLESREALFYAVALAGVLNSAVSLYFYARIVKAMFLEKAGAEAEAVPLNARVVAVLTAFAGPTLVLGVWWSPLVENIERLFSILR